MGCWGTDVTNSDDFYDSYSDVQHAMLWTAYDGTPESIITTQHLNQHLHLVTNNGPQALLRNSAKAHALGYLIMQVKGLLSDSDCNLLVEACAYERDYLDPDGWREEGMQLERERCLKEFQQDLKNHAGKQREQERMERSAALFRSQIDLQRGMNGDVLVTFDVSNEESL